jgi:hypothetical protein
MQARGALFKYTLFGDFLNWQGCKYAASGVSHHFVIALEWHIQSGNGITKKRQGAFLIRCLHIANFTQQNSDKHTSCKPNDISNTHTSHKSEHTNGNDADKWKS